MFTTRRCVADGRRTYGCGASEKSKAVFLLLCVVNVKTEHEHLGQRHRENQSLFCLQHNDSVTIGIVYLYQGLLVEQLSNVVESPCEDTTDKMSQTKTLNVKYELEEKHRLTSWK